MILLPLGGLFVVFLVVRSIRRRGRRKDATQALSTAVLDMPLPRERYRPGKPYRGWLP